MAKKPLTELPEKNPEVELILDGIVKTFDALQKRLLEEAGVLSQEHWHTVNPISRQKDFADRQQYTTRVAETDGGIVQLEWQNLKWNYVIKKFETTRVARGRDKMVYTLDKFRRAKEWELPYIIKTERAFSYIRALSKAIYELRRQLTKTRTRTYSDIAEIMEKMERLLLAGGRIAKRSPCKPNDASGTNEETGAPA